SERRLVVADPAAGGGLLHGQRLRDCGRSTRGGEGAAELPPRGSIRVAGDQQLPERCGGGAGQERRGVRPPATGRIAEAIVRGAERAARVGDVMSEAPINVEEEAHVIAGLLREYAA